MGGDRRRRRPWQRVPIRYRALAGAAIAIALSEWGGGPLTLGLLREATVDGVGAAFDEVHERTSAGEIHLSFDDGPTLSATPEILAVLRRHRATAVFFPIGRQVDEGGAALRQAVADGHRIGNHTWQHDELVGISSIEFEQAVARTQIAVERATGVVPTCLRPPGGAIDEENRARAASAGLAVELWTVDPQDWRVADADALVDAVVDVVRDGDVVLLHDGGGDRSATVAGLDELLDRLGSRGYRFTAIPGC